MISHRLQELLALLIRCRGDPQNTKYRGVVFETMSVYLFDNFRDLLLAIVNRGGIRQIKSDCSFVFQIKWYLFRSVDQVY